MKKTNTKLQFKRDTVRLLQGRELASVIGGAPTNECTMVGTACGSGHTENNCDPHSNNCPPNHSRKFNDCQ